MTSCAMCAHSVATIYCVNDDAALCSSCDVKFHANPLAARHERRPLSCSSLECVSVAGASADSLDDAGVVPQFGAVPVAAPAPLFDNLIPMPVGFPEADLDDFAGAGDFLGDGLDLPSTSDLLNFDFLDCVVPSISEQQSPASALPAVGSMLPEQQKASLNPFMHSFVPAGAPATVPAMLIPLDDIEMAAVVPTKAAAVSAPKRKRAAEVRDNDSYVVEDSESEVDDDDDYVVAPRRGRRKGGRRETTHVVTAYEPEPELTRAQRVARYKEKRARRNFAKTIRYQSRKAYAEIRPRIKGRFVSPEEYAAYMKEHSPRDFEAVVPVC